MNLEQNLPTSIAGLTGPLVCAALLSLASVSRASAGPLGVAAPSIGVFATADARDLADGPRDGGQTRYGGYLRVGVVPGLGLEMSGIAQRDRHGDRVDVYTANLLLGQSTAGIGVFAFGGYGRARVRGRSDSEWPAYTLGAAARIGAIAFPLALEIGGRFSVVDVADSDSMTFTQLFLGLDISL